MNKIKEMEDNIVKDIRNVFRLKRENEKKKRVVCTAIKDIRNLFRLEEENEAIKDRVIRDIKNLLEDKEEKDYCKPVRLGIFLEQELY